MSAASCKIKTIAICFRGFELTPEQAELAVGKKACEAGARGDPVNPGVKSILKRSFIRYAVSLPDTCRVDELIPALWSSLGGVERIQEAVDVIKSDFIEVDLMLPVKGSDEQIGGFILPSSVKELGLLGATLTFQFV